MKKDNNNQVIAIILAAGKGTRMNSPIPKVLHEVCNKSMLQHVVDCLKEAEVNDVVAVIGGELNYFDDFTRTNPHVTFCEQINRQGTADAVASAAVCFLNTLSPSYTSKKLLRGGNLISDYVIICAGDTPAMSGKVIKQFINESIETDADISVLGIEIPNPTGYGRLVFKDKDLLKIVEHKDATENERLIKVVNSGVIFAKKGILFNCLEKVSPNNVQKEYYLTDCIEIAKNHNKKVSVFVSQDWEGFSGVNTPEQKDAIEQILKQRNFNK